MPRTPPASARRAGCAPCRQPDVRFIPWLDGPHTDTAGRGLPRPYAREVTPCKPLVILPVTDALGPVHGGMTGRAGLRGAPTRCHRPSRARPGPPVGAPHP